MARDDPRQLGDVSAHVTAPGIRRLLAGTYVSSALVSTAVMLTCLPDLAASVVPALAALAFAGPAVAAELLG